MMVRERTSACSGTLYNPAEVLVLTITPKAARYYYIHDRWDDIRGGEDNCLVEPGFCFDGNAGVAGGHMHPQFIQVICTDPRSHDGADLY